MKKSHNKFSYNYTTIRVNENILVSGSRDPLDRLNVIPINFQDKTVLDIGCNVGGMLFAIADKIKYGHGYDVNISAIDVATKIKKEQEIENLSFTLANLEEYDLTLLPKTDITFMLSIAIWIPNWKEIVRYLDSSTLIFETHGDSEKKLNQVNFLKTIYPTVTFLNNPEGDYRNLYICTK